VHLEAIISFSFVVLILSLKVENQEFFIISIFRICFCVEQKTEKNGENKKRKGLGVYVGEISICSHYFQ
jgi:hypothetical protein